MGRAAARSEGARALRTSGRRCFVLDVDRAVLERVRRPFPFEPIRTLVAVHLATAELLGEPPPLLILVTAWIRCRVGERSGLEAALRRLAASD